jgi:3-hydroxybutyryl-CoA dehydratase
MKMDLKVGDTLETKPKDVVLENMVAFEKVVWDRGKNSHSDPEAARRDGMKTTIASGQNQMAFLHELLERNFGDGWAYGGKISVRYIHPVYAGDKLTPQGRITKIENGEDGSKRIEVEVWCENQNGEKTSAGRVETGWPTAKMSWLDAAQDKAVA